MSTFNLPLQNIAERAPDPVEAIRRSNDDLSARIRVAIPAQVVSWDAEKQTITAQPLIREKIVNRANGDIQWLNLPPCTDVPVVFPQGGGFVLTFPVQAGDEVLLVFSDLNIDSWWFSGGIQNWDDKRRHDLSDAIAIIGVNSIPNVIPNISSIATELRSKTGAVKVSISGDEITLSAPTVTLDGDTVNINGTINTNGHAFLSHHHTGVQSGPNQTGGVVWA